ncbi:MAG: LCP family protein [Clostridia bacterium]|nr:LCP family protein [Clostridia bacterium]
MNIKKYFASLLVTILVFVTVTGGVWVARFMFGTSLADEIASLLDKPVDKLNFLLLGTDKGGARADVIMLVSFDPKEHTVKVMSIPRDTRVDVNGKGRYDKINHTLGYKEGEKTLISAVKRITGMPINYYAQIDFEGFRNVIDAVDGVYFDLPINMNYDDPYQDLHIHLNKGYQHFDGKKAEGVVRFRASYVNGDEGRISMQQDFLKAIFEQKLTPQYLAKAPQIIDEVYKNVKTNFAVSDALKYVSSLKKLTSESLSTFELPGHSQYMYGISYYVYDKAKVEELVLYEFGYPEDKAAELKKAQEAQNSTTSAATEK